VRPLASPTTGRAARETPVPIAPIAPIAPIEVRNRNTGARASLRLYDDGEIDPAALATFMRVAASRPSIEEPMEEPLDVRLVQLAMRAAYHFHAKALVVVSATRKGAHGKHGTGEALDFQLEGVSAAALAAHARSYPRAGVGVYTHPKTQYVHLDVRDQSYHWLDGSPPGVTWRERRLADPGRAKRDAAYLPSMDWPEASAGALGLPSASREARRPH
jgi:uncharacterized protein YcbK (DUF882 family)